MAKVIEFYIPDFFATKASSITPSKRGEVIELSLPRGKKVTMQFHEPAAHDPRTKAGPIPMWTL